MFILLVDIKIHTGIYCVKIKHFGSIKFILLVWTVSNIIFLFQWYTYLFTYVILLTIFFRDVSKLCDKENCKHIWCFRQINKLMFVCIIFLTTTNLDNKPSINHITYAATKGALTINSYVSLFVTFFCLLTMLSRNTPEKILDALYSLFSFRIIIW